MPESSTMRELHEIRVKNYERTRNMTKEEKIKYINTKGAQAKQRIEELKKAKM